MFSLYVHLVSYTWSTTETRLFWLMLEHHGRNGVSGEEKCAASVELCVCKLSGASDWSKQGANSVLALGYIPLWICSPATSENGAFCVHAGKCLLLPSSWGKGGKRKVWACGSLLLDAQPSIKLLLCHSPLTKWILRGRWWAFTCLDQSSVDSLSTGANDVIALSS